jgi:hypothetical protein
MLFGSGVKSGRRVHSIITIRTKRRIPSIGNSLDIVVDMLITLGQANAPTTVIQYLFNIQHRLSPNYNINWDLKHSTLRLIMMMMTMMMTMMITMMIIKMLMMMTKISSLRMLMTMCRTIVRQKVCVCYQEQIRFLNTTQGEIFQHQLFSY